MFGSSTNRLRGMLEIASAIYNFSKASDTSKQHPYKPAGTHPHYEDFDKLLLRNIHWGIEKTTIYGIVNNIAPKSSRCVVAEAERLNFPPSLLSHGSHCLEYFRLQYKFLQVHNAAPAIFLYCCMDLYWGKG